MELVIDSNMLQSAELKTYLSEDPANMAVLPDFIWIEIYKQCAIEGVVSATAIFSSFVDQVVVTKTGQALAGLDPGDPDFRSQMLGAPPGDDLRLMSDALRQAAAGEPGVLAQLSIRWSEAASHVQGMTAGALDIMASLPEIAAVFTPDELRRCRTNAPYTRGMSAKVFGITSQIYESLSAMPGAAEPLQPPQAIGAYLYRFALGIVIYLLGWIRNGSQVPKRADKVRNDIIDLGIVVCATYFDGLMTDDTKARKLHLELSNALKFATASAALLPDHRDQ